MKQTIKDIPILDRPRERLINVGVTNLGNEEILAIIINTGTNNISAKQLANDLLIKAGSINNINSFSYEELIKIKGIGKAKACFLLATFELANRINTKVVEINSKKYISPDLIFNYYKDKLGQKKKEYFYAVYLDNNKKILGERLHFVGTINQSLVHPREIFKEAYLLISSGIILIHNHPTGNVLPSKEDVDTTTKLKEVGILLGIKILDHIIISSNKYYSFFENGLL